MPDESQALLRRLIGGDASAVREIRERASVGGSASLLVMAALTGEQGALLLARAAAAATTTRDRQLVAIATAHLDGDRERFDVLVRDHLLDHPDSVLASWLASRSVPTTHTQPANSKEAS